MSGRGITVATAKIYVRLVDIFFGSTDSPKVQREPVAPAEERGLSIEYLEIVNKHAKKLKTRSAAWKLHTELNAFAGTPEEVDAYCNKRVTEEGGDKPKEKGVRIGRAIDGLRTIIITDTQQKITELEKTLGAAIANEYQPRSEALLEPF